MQFSPSDVDGLRPISNLCNSTDAIAAFHPRSQQFRDFTRWAIPARYNIGIDVADRWAAAEPERAAILDVLPDGRVETLVDRFEGGADAVLAASIFHFGEITIGDAKAAMAAAGIPISPIARERVGA